MENNFYFVRHAETDWNEKKLCQGQKDILLNEAGIFEAKTFAWNSRGMNIQCIVSSPLSRALKTANELRNVHPQAQFYVLNEFSERGWGDLEGISSERMYEIEEQEEQDPLYNPGYGVELRSAFHNRVLMGLSKAQRFHSSPLIVSHGRVFLQICLALNVQPIRQIPNCKLFEFSFSASGWAVNGRIG